VDEALGRSTVPDAPCAALEPGEHVGVPIPGTPDEAWLEHAGKNGWIVFTKDRRLTRAPNELDALRRNHVAVFTVGEADGAEHARRFVEALDTIRRFARSAELPFVAAVDERLELVVRYEAGKRLEKPRTVMGKGRA
jgi:rRNA-processing protein FCF1